MEEWILKRLDEIKSRFEEIEVLMTKKEIVSNQSEMKKISKEYSKLKTINELWDQYNKILKPTLQATKITSIAVIKAKIRAGKTFKFKKLPIWPPIRTAINKYQ